MSAHLTETLTYKELVERLNEYGETWNEGANRRTGASLRWRPEPPPDPPAADWLLVIRADPPQKLADALIEVQQMKPPERLGLLADRDQGDRQSRLLLNGYYSAVLRLLPEISGDGLQAPRNFNEWRDALEADTPEAEQLDELVGYLGLFYLFRREVDRGKSGGS